MAANAKLALFYDWLFFDIRQDNIMNIEPAVLLMMHSMPKYSGLTLSLIEFLLLLIEHYDPPRREYIKQGVMNSMKIILSKGVVKYVSIFLLVTVLMI